MKIDQLKEINSNNYITVWISFVDIQALNGKNFHELLDGCHENYIGAWGNILTVCNFIDEVPNIIEQGLNELGMSIRFIDKIENVKSLVEYDEINDGVKEEIDWLLSSEYKFLISDKLFPYITM